ncbi:MAG: hypothetical protein GF331_19130 [Chitinivibrionales bacterium]|nr:hypothetical protein [Chitinivibrionales bacterium]
MKAQGVLIVLVSAGLAVFFRCDTDSSSSPVDDQELVTRVMVDTSALAVSDSVDAVYRRVAHALAIQMLEAEERPETSDVYVPTELVDSLYRALCLLYHAIDLPARDSVVELYPTIPCRTDLLYDQPSFALTLDTAYTWTKALLTDTTVVDSSMRSLMNAHKLSADTLAISDGLSIRWVLTSDTVVNPTALADVLGQVPGVRDAHFSVPPPQNCSSVGFRRETDRWDAGYEYRWADILGHYWAFELHDSGLVCYTGSSGDDLSTAPVH